MMNYQIFLGDVMNKKLKIVLYLIPLILVLLGSLIFIVYHAITSPLALLPFGIMILLGLILFCTFKGVSLIEGWE